MLKTLNKQRSTSTAQNWCVCDRYQESASLEAWWPPLSLCGSLVRTDRRCYWRWNTHTHTHTDWTLLLWSWASEWVMIFKCQHFQLRMFHISERERGWIGPSDTEVMLINFFNSCVQINKDMFGIFVHFSISTKIWTKVLWGLKGCTAWVHHYWIIGRSVMFIQLRCQ